MQKRKWYAKKFFEFFRAIPGAPDQPTRETITGLLNAGEVVCPWFKATSDSAEWLATLRDDSDKPDEWVTLPFSLSGSPGSRTSHPHVETKSAASDNDVTIIFGKSQSKYRPLRVIQGKTGDGFQIRPLRVTQPGKDRGRISNPSPESNSARERPGADFKSVP